MSNSNVLTRQVKRFPFLASRKFQVYKRNISLFEKANLATPNGNFLAVKFYRLFFCITLVHQALHVASLKNLIYFCVFNNKPRIITSTTMPPKRKAAPAKEKESTEVEVNKKESKKKGASKKTEEVPAEPAEAADANGETKAKRGRKDKVAAPVVEEKEEEAEASDEKGEESPVEEPPKEKKGRGKKNPLKNEEPEEAPKRSRRQVKAAVYKEENDEEALEEKSDDEENDEEVELEKPKGRGRAKKTKDDENGGGDKPKAKGRAKKEPQPSTSKSGETLMNPTETNYDKIDFLCKKENALGEESNFIIASWNVDGLRAWLKKDGLKYLEYEKPDVFCIQESKCAEDKLPDEIKNLEGYEQYWQNSEKEGYAGVGLFSRTKPIGVEYGIGVDEHDEEGRCITAEYEKFYVVSVYVPNAGRKLVTLPKRLEWNKAFKKYIKELDKKKPVIVCGDMNVAHSEIDLANPKTNTKNAGFTKEEREGMTEFLEDGYVDTYRKFYPEKTGAYTFWTYMMKSRSKNVGWRLDYFIVSERFVDKICDNIIRSEVLGSDHCPIALFLNV
ncbi:hypothetical protein ILUMI_02444 [Ignelater luminosus]|uniref:DNA-(apurinic or apyrimidinic site) endonuclease n=1 Tax=Ignelater luminosus TaxID=2038154 RepID=A0A8K0GLC5_IGNLU|nr:hypothetical protein ILUMI_02444 [Ignelater luminosus]